MATSLLATGSTSASSASFVLAAGESASLLLVGGSSPDTRVAVEMQASDNSWVEIASLNTRGSSHVLQAIGTFRVTRPAGRTCGVDRG